MARYRHPVLCPIVLLVALLGLPLSCGKPSGPSRNPDCGAFSGSENPEDATTPQQPPSPSYPREKAPQAIQLDAARASLLVQLSLRCVDRPYPNKPGHILDGDETVVPPRAVTPAFFGCFDWHSAVHGHWAMARVLESFPELEEAKEIVRTLDTHLSRENIQAELAFLQQPRNRTFERPYGWGWMLRLAAELHRVKDPRFENWAENVQPLASHLALEMESYLKRLSRPVREGTHANTAYSLVHALDYARETGDQRLEESITTSARRFFLADRNCPVDYEPSGEDFISPCLAEADLMRRILSPDEFRAWFREFLPVLYLKGASSIESPPEVLDPQDPRIGHLIGLAFQRAASANGIASALDASDPARHRLALLASRQGAFALELVDSSGYGGEHWLATFALYYLTQAGLP